MKIAVASMGTVPEAWVGVRFGLCSQFLVFDLDTMDYVIVSVPPRQTGPEDVSLEAIRAIAKQGASAVITGHIKPLCRKTLLDLGIDVIDGVEGLTVGEAVERFKATGLKTPAQRLGLPTRIAVISQGDNLDARIEPHFDECTSFLLIDPQTMAWQMIRVEPDGPSSEMNLNAVRAIARNGATVLITPEIHPECCLALQALAVMVYIAPAGITIREAIAQYQQGGLEESPLNIYYS